MASPSPPAHVDVNSPEPNQLSFLQSLPEILAKAKNAERDSPSPAQPIATVNPNVDLQTLLASLNSKPPAPAPLSPSQQPSLSPDEEQLYQKFLDDERRVMQNLTPDTFPQGSRLFIGNLPTEKVSKRELFRIFHKHGRLAQISLKQAYGFVQFHTAETCMAAIRAEQGVVIGGRKMHLEVSKPQKRGHDRTRRSRSPPESRPSRRRGYNHNAELPSRGRYDEPSRTRRFRSPSPVRRPPADEFPLPRRYGSDVPECQIIVIEEVDRSYIWHVEKGLRDVQFRVDTLFLSPRVPVQVVVRQMILEGVNAVIFIDRQLQAHSKVSVQIFDRRTSHGDVRFEEYANIDVPIAVELLVRLKYAGGAPSTAPNLANLIGSLDPNTLTKVIGALSQQPTYKPPPATNMGSLLGGAQVQQPSQPAASQQVQNIMEQLARLRR